MKKYKIKSIGLSGFVGILLISLSLGCGNKFLDVQPQGQEESEQFWKSKDDASKAVNAMYALLRSWNIVAFPAIAIMSMPSDDAEKGSTPGDATFMNNFDQFKMTSTAGQLDGFWKGEYQEINLCNQVIDHVDTMDIDNSLSSRFIAEAKFIRAFCYFRLVRAFGGVPLRLHLPDDPSQYNLSRAPAEEVYDSIEQDLMDATSVLPKTYNAKDIGHATKGAALTLHAKVAMYREEWQKVYDLTQQVMDLNIYQLYGMGQAHNFFELFRIPNENNVESIFEIQCEYVPGKDGLFYSQYSQVQGDRDVSPSPGWGFNVPTQSLVDAFDSPNDTRLEGTVMFAGTTLPNGDVVPSAGANSPTMYNLKSYVPFATASTTNQGAGQNIRVLRYAGVLLMHAEAANELTKTTEALNALNLVRKRARGNNPNILPDITETDQDALRKIIWHERHLEFAMEYDRFFDLVRQGRAADVLSSKGFQSGKNELMPIPQNEIDLSGGLLEQNPGY